jgi:predicted nucleic acid-binding protein
MRSIFVDTLYWVAILHRKDQWHRAAQAASRLLVGCRLITTDEVLTEVLAAFSQAGPALRWRAALLVRDLHRDPAIEILPQTRQTFLDGLSLYESRLDKGYSLTDCISMDTMRRGSIAEILTHDKHFVQEGFVVLL